MRLFLMVPDNFLDKKHCFSPRKPGACKNQLAMAGFCYKPGGWKREETQFLSAVAGGQQTVNFLTAARLCTFAEPFLGV